MKKRNLNSLKLNKKSISTLQDNAAITGGQSRSQCNSACGYSCDQNLCGSVEPWKDKNKE